MANASDVLSEILGSAEENAALQAGAQTYRAKPSRAAAARDLLRAFWRTHAASPRCWSLTTIPRRWHASDRRSEDNTRIHRH